MKHFKSGNTYRNLEHDEDIMVIGIYDHDEFHTLLAVFWVDRDTQETLGADELHVEAVDYSNWEPVTYE